MNPDHFVKVFDVVDVGFKDWTFPAFGVVFTVLMAFNVAFPTLLGQRVPLWLTTRPKAYKAFRYALLVFVVLWTAFAFNATFSSYLRHKRLVEQNGCRIVEGPVENFVPMPYTGHASESFTVAGVGFHYSDYILNGGFNNTSSHGGPIKADSYLRICYDPSDQTILRLEIRRAAES